VPAYSTLGWFDDPVISTFIQYPDGELARLIFHELAHQVCMRPAIRPSMKALRWRWRSWAGALAGGAPRSGDGEAYQRFAPASGIPGAAGQVPRPAEGQLRQRRQRRRQAPAQGRHLRRPACEYATIKARWNGYAGYDRWFAMPLSNAHLALVGAYHDMVPAFRGCSKAVAFS
jgi:hypothetical protein